MHLHSCKEPCKISNSSATLLSFRSGIERIFDLANIANFSLKITSLGEQDFGLSTDFDFLHA